MKKKLLKRFIRFSKKFKGLVKKIKAFYPNLDSNLDSCNIKLSAEDFLGVNLVRSILISSVFFIILVIYFYFSEKIMVFKKLPFLFLLSFIVFFLAFLIFNNSPKLMAKNKIKRLEKELPEFIQQLYIRVTAGMPLYAGIENIAQKNYGEISDLARRIVAYVKGGMNEVEALERISKEMPSKKLSKLFWQITNSIKSGADISKTLNLMAQDLEKEQIISIDEFSSKLTPLTMMYLLLTIIFPALGTSFLIIISSLFGGGIRKEFLWILPIYVIIINMVFFRLMNKIKQNINI